MCEHEVIGDYYRGCKHFHGRYYTGEKTDCAGAMHVHPPTMSCRCPTIATEKRRVQNMYQTKHSDCT
ncbi:hypothetical protein BV20DRAFT_1039655 [Pilatotrama ljubarskyi]|nr:hypothetical protein BV20DRAFT_1039655 [Pilatotrama ljubarskyi]